MNKKLMNVMFCIICLVLTFAISMQIKTVESTNSKVSHDITENKLRDEVLKWKQRYDSISNSIKSREKELENIRKKTTENDTTAIAMEEQLEKINALLGLTDVKGKGVIVTLDDNKTIDPNKVISIDPYLIHDTNILKVVNELKAAGAEAISVNELRITSMTSITCVGPVVRINGERVAAPYTIKAIGFPESLMSLNMPGGLIQALKSQGKMVEIKKENNIEIYKYDGIITKEFMQYLD